MLNSSVYRANKCNRPSGILGDSFRRTRAPCRAPGPFGSAIPSEDCPERNRSTEQDRLNRSRHDQDGLRPTMTQGNVCEIEERRPIRRTRVHDLEHGL
jgi:hypothetical protein